MNAPGSVIGNAFGETYWYKDGFELYGTQRRFRYYQKKNREEGHLMLIDEYRSEIVLIDWGMDGTIDEIRVPTEAGVWKYFRGAPGSEARFAKADETWARHRYEMNVNPNVEKWRAAGPDGSLELRGMASF